MDNTNNTINPAGSFPTWEDAYSIVAIQGGAREDGLTLYEAVKALRALAADGHAVDATHIRRDGRCVAFHCDWRGTVRAMFGANDTERANVADWT